MRNPILVILLLLLHGCAEKKTQYIFAKIDYDQYLNTKVTPTKDATIAEIFFWQARLEKDSTSLVDLGKLAGLYSSLFAQTGDVTQLYKSEKYLKRACTLSTRNKDLYLRSLAQIYISQHRFKEAKVLLDSAYTFPDNKRDTELLLYDINMEIGDYTKADEYLGKIKNNSDYHYLIRLSKWSDYKGDLDSAIKYMKRAMDIAESSGSKPIILWTYTNLADYYVHAGRIEDAYTYYLKALRLLPESAYAKKGIAWILYVSEKNTSEANRILDSIMVNHKVPDYYLQKAEMAEFDKNPSEVKKHQQKFNDAINSSDYGNMYNTHLIKLFAEISPEKALALAQKEITRRSTPETYLLLAYAQVQAGRKEEALITLETHVLGKTFEPMSHFYQGLVYLANGLENKIPDLKRELLNHPFELGPVVIRKLQEW